VKPPSRWPSPAKPFGARLLVAMRLVVPAGLIGLLLRSVDLAEIGRLLLALDPLWFLTAVGIMAADRALMIGKWYPLLVAQVPGVSLGAAVRAYLATSFMSIVLPASVGSDLFRALALGHGSGKVVEVAASIVVERLLGFFATGVVCLSALLVAMRAGVSVDFLLPWALAAVVVALAALVLPLVFGARIGTDEAVAGPRSKAEPTTTAAGPPRGLRARVVRLVRRFADAHARYRRRPLLIAVVAGLSVVEQTFPIMVLWCLARGLGTSITPEMLWVAVPLTLFVSRLPIAIWSLGVVEVSLVYLLGLFGVPATQALAVALGGRAVEMVGLLPGAFFLRDLTTTVRAGNSAVSRENASPQRPGPTPSA